MKHLLTIIIATLAVVGAQADNGPPQVRAESGRGSMEYTHWELPNTGDIKAYQRAATQGDAAAQFNLSLMYDSGRGVARDPVKAVKWLRKSAEQGYTRAQKNLGAKYGMGQGVPQDDIESFVWSSVAALSGDEGAVSNRNLAASKLSAEDLDEAQKRATKLQQEIQHNTTAQ